MGKSVAEEWARRLGLATSRLFGTGAPAPQPGSHTALLDGIAGSFLMSEADGAGGGSRPMQRDAADWSWSALMRHHVSLSDDDVSVTRSSTEEVERFSKASVEQRLPDFLQYLEGDRSAKPFDAVDHVVRCFQNLRAEIGGDPRHHLTAFLGLIGLRIDTPDIDAEDLPDCLSKVPATLKAYGMGDDMPSLSELTADVARRFYHDLLNRGETGRRLHLELTIRHASGDLFQAANMAPAPKARQADFWSLPAVRVRPHSLKGLAYTPLGLARVLAEEAVHGKGERPGTPLVLMDPSCGSGTFLIEAIAALARQGWRGRVRAVGFDISPAAVASARFALACSRHAHAGSGLEVEVDVRPQDFLDANFQPPAADIVVMNPPYVAWPEQTDAEKALLRDILGAMHKGRPDLSLGFVTKALRSSKPGAIVATLLPAGVLTAEYAERWREGLLEEAVPRLIATLGDHGVFRFAVVNIAALVLAKDATEATRIDGRTEMVWASEAFGAASAALRHLRMRRAGVAGQSSSGDGNWTSYGIEAPQLRDKATWLPAPGLLGPAMARFCETDATKVRDLFVVRLGVRSGDRGSFVISEADLHALPPGERRGFQAIAESGEIVDGEVRPAAYLFTAGEDLTDEGDLARLFPHYLERHLLDRKDALRARKRVKYWWSLGEARNKWKRNKEPRIVSRRFVKNNGFAVDPDGRYAVVQGFAWFPTPALKLAAKENRRGGDLLDVLRLYCVMMSSDVFFRIVREYSLTIAGGQVDLQQRFIYGVPMPSLPALLTNDRSVESLADRIRNAPFPPLELRNEFAEVCYRIDGSFTG